MPSLPTSSPVGASKKLIAGAAAAVGLLLAVCVVASVGLLMAPSAVKPNEETSGKISEARSDNQGLDALEQELEALDELNRKAEAEEAAKRRELQNLNRQIDPLVAEG